MPNNFGGSGYSSSGNSSGGGAGWGGAAGGVVGAFMGIGQAQRQYHRQKKLNVQQYGHQRMLNQQGHDLQYDMWNKTNYKAQLEHMKAAGLNPALMYGSAGAPGTTGSQGGGSAQGGSAATETAMDISNMAMIGAQLKLMEAQKGKTEEEGRLAGEKADAVGGYEKGESESRTGVNVAQTRKIEEEIGNISADTVKKVQETTNLKTIDEVNEFERQLKKLRKERGDKGFLQGDMLGNLLQAVNMDPVNNETDRLFLQAILIGMGVLRAGTDIGKIITSLKPGFKK